MSLQNNSKPASTSARLSEFVLVGLWVISIRGKQSLLLHVNTSLPCRLPRLGRHSGGAVGSDLPLAVLAGPQWAGRWRSTLGEYLIRFERCGARRRPFKTISVP